jgi:hypothetical protein
VPLIDAVKIYGEAVAEVMETGEHLLAMGALHAHRAAEDHEPHLTENVDWTGVRYDKERTLPAVPPPGSWGRRTLGALQSRAVTSLDWAVTDRRLLLLDNYRINPQRFRLHLAIPRAAIRTARRRGRLLLPWGRVELTFVDGSMAALVLAVLDRTAVTAFLRALR